MISVIITAGGSSSRFGQTNKLLYKINEKPIIYHSVMAFCRLDYIDEIVICAKKEIIKDLKEIFANEKKIKITIGGDNRQQSVLNGLKCCTNCEYVIIHDGARPFIKEETIKKCLDMAKQTSAAIVGVRTTDTIKIADKNGQIISTPDRNTLWNAQTPQIFKYKTILTLHEKYKGLNLTDDALLYEKEGLNVSIVEGEYSNIKITTPFDIKNCK